MVGFVNFLLVVSVEPQYKMHEHAFKKKVVICGACRQNKSQKVSGDLKNRLTADNTSNQMEMMVDQ